MKKPKLPRLAALFGCICVLSSCGIVRNAQIENERKCRGMDELSAHLRSGNTEHFRDWTGAMFDSAEQRIGTCATAWGRDKSTQAEALERLRDVRAEVEGGRIARQAAWNAEIERLAQCARTPEYRLFKAHDNIVNIQESNRWVQSQLDHEREVAAASGVIDLRLQHDLGELLVQNRDRLAAAWREYKQAGGSARTPDQVKPIPNPCTTKE